MTGKRPLENISYADIVAARVGSRSKTVDIACPSCGPLRDGSGAQRKVLRTWTLGGDRISLHCVRCGLEGYVVPDGGAIRGGSNTTSINRSRDDDERARRSAEAAKRIWREAVPIAGTVGEAYLRGRGIELGQVPNYGGLRWHPRCPWGADDYTPCILARFTDAVTNVPGGIHRRPIDGQKPRTLGPMKGCVIRLWPDAAVTTGLVLGEGVETTLAASQIVHRGTLLQPAWAAANTLNMAGFPALSGIETLTILVDNDANGAGQQAAAECARRWVAAGRQVIRLVPKIVGDDFNDIIRKGNAA